MTENKKQIYERRVSMFNEGKTAEEIGAAEWRSAARMRAWLREHGFTYPSRNPRPKLDPAIEAARLDLVKKGRNDRQIAKEMRCSHQAISNWRKSRGIPVFDPSQHPDRIARRAQIEAVLRRGIPDAEAAEELGLAVTSVQQYRASLGLPSNNGPVAWALTPQTEARRRALLAAGFLARTVAALEEVQSQTIHRWMRLRGIAARPREARLAPEPEYLCPGCQDPTRLRLRGEDVAWECRTCETDYRPPLIVGINAAIEGAA